MAKTQKTELEAAIDFVLTMCQKGESQWPSICDGLQQFEPKFKEFRGDVFVSYEFTLASISVQMHAIDNLFPLTQAGRIREHVLECLTTEKFGNYQRDAIAAYDAAWNDYIERSQPPFNGVAVVLFRKLGLASSVTIETDTFINPVVLLAIGGTLVRFGGSYWKDYRNNHEIIASV